VKRYPIIPIPKPRMTSRDKHRPSHKRYFKFCEDVRMVGVRLKRSGDHVLFKIPMPKSWSKVKKKMFDGQPHEQKPDLDNLIKALGDAIFKDDSGIWDIRATKVWGYEGEIIIK